MPREIPYIQAINEAITEEMQRDPSVVFYGQNIALTDEDPMVKAFGRQRVRVTPISETAEMGMAVGTALVGLRPVVELLMTDFMLVGLDQVLNEAARMRFKSGGQVTMPIVFKAGYGFAAGWSVQHTNCWYTLFLGAPGLKVVAPSTAADAKGLMKAAIRDDNPVVYLHHYMLTLVPGEVPDGDYVIPFGKAQVVREGRDISIFAHSRMTLTALEAADKLAEEGISAEVIDPRSLMPLDKETILESVKRTHRAVIVHEAVERGGVANWIASLIQEEVFDYLDAPIGRVAGAEVPMPYSKPLERAAIPSAATIVTKAKQILNVR